MTRSRAIRLAVAAMLPRTIRAWLRMRRRRRRADHEAEVGFVRVHAARVVASELVTRDAAIAAVSADLVTVKAALTSLLTLAQRLHADREADAAEVEQLLAKVKGDG